VKTVYIAGAYSDDNILGVFANMRNGMLMAVQVLKSGFAPFVPWFDYHFSLLADDITLDMYYNYSMTWLERADCVLVLDGWEKSKGTRAEIARAELLSKPIYYDFCSLVNKEAR